MLAVDGGGGGVEATARSLSVRISRSGEEGGLQSHFPFWFKQIRNEKFLRKIQAAIKLKTAC